MRRRLPSERLERFRSDRTDHFKELACKAARWVADYKGVLGAADPEMPDALHDRAGDNWRACFAIADCAGRGWGKRAREAALTLSTRESAHENLSKGVMLLADIRQILDDRRNSGVADAARISSTDLASALASLTDRPWRTCSRGNPITAATVARLLKPYGIFPHAIRLANDKVPNGYQLDDFDDAFGRYLPSSRDSGFQTSNASNNDLKSGAYGQNQGSNKEGAVGCLKTGQAIDCSGVLYALDVCGGYTGEREDRGQLADQDEAWLDEFFDKVHRRSLKEPVPSEY
jgi:hypothetical protein